MAGVAGRRTRCPSRSLRANMVRIRRSIATALPILVFAALAGCGDDGGSSGGDLPKDDLQRDISQRLAQATGSSAPEVVCPSDLPAAIGSTIRCRVAVEGTSYGVTVTVKGTEGGTAQYDLQVDTE